MPVAPAPSTVPSQQDHGSLHRTLAPVAPLARQEDDSNFGVQTFLAPRTQQHYGPDYPFGQPSQDGHMPLPGHFGSSFVPIHQYQGHPHQQQYQPYHPPSQQQPGQQLPSYGQQNSFGVPEFPYNFEIESGRRAPSRPTGFQRGSFDDASPPRTINRSTTWFDQYGMPDTDSRSRLPSTSAPVGTSQQDPVHSTAGDDRYRMVDEYEDRGSTRGRSHVGAYSQPGTEDASAYRDQHPSGQPSRSQPMYRQSERQIGPAINRAPPPPPPPPSQSRPPRLQLQAPGPFGIPPDPFDTGEESPRFHPSHLPDDSTSATQFWRNARFNVPADYARDPHANEFLRDLERDADQTAAIAAVVRRVPDALARILRQFGVTEPPGLNRQTRVAVGDLTRTFSIYMPELHPSDATEPLVRALLHQAGLCKYRNLKIGLSYANLGPDRYGEETWLLFVQLCWRRNKSLPPPILMEQIQDIIRIAERNGIRAVLPGSSVQRPRNRTNQGVGGPSQGSQSRRRRQQASSSGATTAGGGDADGPSVVEDDDDIMRQPSSSQATAHDTSSLQTGTALRQGGSALGTHPHSSPSSQRSEQRPRRRPRLSDPSTESSSAFHVSSATTLDGQAHSPVEEDRRDPPELPKVDDSDEDLYEEPTAERALQVNQFLQQHAQQQLAHVGNTFRDAGAMEAATTEEAQGVLQNEASMLLLACTDHRRNP